MPAEFIKVHELNNTRDLGETVHAYGKTIRKGLLFRGAELYHASPEDIEWLQKHISLIIDLRTEIERKEKPDPAIEMVANIHLPIMESLTPGVTHDEASYARSFLEIANNPDAARDYMLHIYRNMIISDFARSQFRAFLNLLLENRQSGVLWHCTAGKDRTGFAALLVEELLDIPREVICEDYLITNVYRSSETEQMIRELVGRFPEGGRAEQGMRMLFGAQPEYFHAWYTAAEEMYGSMKSYIRDGLGINDELKMKFQEIYLA